LDEVSLILLKVNTNRWAERKRGLTLFDLDLAARWQVAEGNSVE